MIVTVLWEDSRGVETRDFGPHELLLSCVADELEVDAWDRRLRDGIESVPKKGNGGVRTALRDKLVMLAKSGPVFAVLDSDRAHELWRPAVAACKTTVRTQLQADAPGDYTLVLLVENVESLVDAVLVGRGLPRLPLGKKPNPNERDQILRGALGDPALRGRVRKDCASFDRLVRKVGEQAQSLLVSRT